MEGGGIESDGYVNDLLDSDKIGLAGHFAKLRGLLSVSGIITAALSLTDLGICVLEGRRRVIDND